MSATLFHHHRLLPAELMDTHGHLVCGSLSAHPSGEQKLLHPSFLPGLHLQHSLPTDPSVKTLNSGTEQLPGELGPGLPGQLTTENQDTHTTVSSPVTFSTGCPQGCVLGPLLIIFLTVDCSSKLRS